MVNALGLEQDLHSGDKVAKIRHLRQHVVPQQQVGLLPSPGQFLGQLLAEELHQGGNIPSSTATLATFTAGSMPSTGTLLLTKYCKR